MGDWGASHAIGVPLLERQADLAELREAIAGTHSGYGRLILIEGAAGTGKSRLLHAAAELAGSSGLRVLQASGSATDGPVSQGDRELAAGAATYLMGLTAYHW